MSEQFKVIKRKSIGLGQNGPDFTRITDFQGPLPVKPLSLREYGAQHL
jgi:hypothetical protein